RRVAAHGLADSEPRRVGAERVPAWHGATHRPRLSRRGCAQLALRSRQCGEGLSCSVMTLGVDDLVLCAGTLPRETSWRERLAAASSAGFTGVSVWARDYEAARVEGLTDADMRAQLEDLGLAIAEIDPAWWWTPGDVDVASLVAIDTMDVFRYGEAEMFAIAEALGARSI